MSGCVVVRERGQEWLAQLRAHSFLAGKERRWMYFRKQRECQDSDLNSVKLYEYEPAG